jgi:hypothetical protein
LVTPLDIAFKQGQKIWFAGVIGLGQNAGWLFNDQNMIVFIEDLQRLVWFHQGSHRPVAPQGKISFSLCCRQSEFFGSTLPPKRGRMTRLRMSRKDDGARPVV